MTGEYVWDPGEANPKQKLFFASRSLYTAYGGAKGGGKTWAVRTKALLGEQLGTLVSTAQSTLVD